MPDSAATLKKKNQALKVQIDVLSEELNNLKAQLSAQAVASPANSDKNYPESSAAETETSLQYLSDKHDEFEIFQARAKQELTRLSNRLAELSIKVNEIGKAIDDMDDYSYQYNIKIVGLPQSKSQESAIDTSILCVKLFSEMRTAITLQDIDIAHRVPHRNAAGNTPKPIICKFVRRLAKEAVMARRNDACKANPANLGLSGEVSLCSVRLFDHLSPKMQHVFSETKSFKINHQFEFCWAKNSCVYLRKDRDSRALKIKGVEDLQKLL